MANCISMWPFKVKIKQIFRFPKSCLELYPGSDPLTLYLYITLEFFAVFMPLCQHLKAANLNSNYSVTTIIECLKIKSVCGDENDCTLFKISSLNAINFRHLSSCGT